MTLFTPAEAALAHALRDLTLSNPFLPERIEAERAILKDAYRGLQPVWSSRAGLPEETSNIVEIRRRAEALAAAGRDRLAEGATPEPGSLRLYEDVALYVLYERYRDGFRARADEASRGLPPGDFREMWELFKQDARMVLRPSGVKLPHDLDAAHLFALFFQIRRAFTHIFDCLVGASMAGARLRAAVWQSIFTYNLHRYQRALFKRMGDLNTLVTGPSGTGKELVARAIGLSRYIPFDTKTAEFKGDIAGEFHAVNLSSLSPTLIESELFGHRKGAFTGALANRKGWFEVCGASGAVFLDEIGEIPTDLQAKLLRVLEERSFVPLGESAPRQFGGKIIAATNRDLAEEMRKGRFREDLYYRLCADVIRTPSLAEQLAEAPEEMTSLVGFLAARLLGESAERDAFVTEATAWIATHLGPDYPWPGNFRELEQCVRNLLLRREYVPVAGRSTGDPEAALVAGVREGSLTADELIKGYATLVHSKLGTYEATARRLGLDGRTVKSKIRR
jgi:transcriptional regulator of acetoin/glycerol metabolism